MKRNIGAAALGGSTVLSVSLAINIAALHMAFLYAPPEATLGEFYRIFFIHAPAAWVSYLAFGACLAGSVLHLMKGDMRWDFLSEASARLGILYCGVALATGSIFAAGAWGSFWNWDPRETTTLILFVTYVSLLALRSAVNERIRRARLSAVYGIVAFPTVPISYVSVRLFSLHPIVVTSGGLLLTSPMIATLVVSMVAQTLLFLQLLSVSYRVSEARDKLGVLKASIDVEVR